MGDDLVERLTNALSQASITPGFANDMVVWSDLAGSVQEAMSTLQQQRREIGEAYARGIEHAACVADMHDHRRDISKAIRLLSTPDNLKGGG